MKKAQNSVAWRNIAGLFAAVFVLALLGSNGAAWGAAFQWRSTAPLLLPKPDSLHDSIAVKDPSVVFANGKFHVFMTTSDSKGWHMAYTSFADWKDAAQAPVTYLDQSKIGPGYRAAPQVFYFAPQRLWYLIFQGGDPLYSTTADIDDPLSWSAPKPFFARTPELVKQTIGKGYWLDFWNICDEQKCYLFGADDNGHIFRSETSVAQFPNGFSNTVIAMQAANRADLFEALMAYQIAGTKYYLIAVEAMGPKGRYFRAWMSDRLDGAWYPLADRLGDAFAGTDNVTFDGPSWAQGVSHGELLRSGNDQRLPVDFCKPLQFLYQGVAADTGHMEYSKLPYRIGLLTADKQPDLCPHPGATISLPATTPLLPPATAPLPKGENKEDAVLKKMILNASADSWGGYGASFAVRKDDTVNGGKAARYSAIKKTNAWEAAASVAIKAPVKKGDVILAAFWARAETPPEPGRPSRLPVAISLSQPPYTAQAADVVTISDKWAMYYLSGLADADYEAGQLNLSIQLAADTQAIDLGPAFVLDFGSNYDRSKLPRNKADAVKPPAVR